MHDDGVPGPGVGEKVGQAGALDGGAALFVDVDLFVGNTGVAQGVELALQALFGGGDPGIPQFEAAGGVAVV
ncbi:hypothetical protein B7755_000110 [Streptomyces sp. NBS 14/10]|nr:hypothetical protein [Streptomyces sp. NBS 14/10]KAK1176758.1 hypothetical protein B7755_000110 [Streptomyces sp. NBS 14/10]